LIDWLDADTAIVLVILAGVVVVFLLVIEAVKHRNR